MKFTKILALALVLMMLVSAFVACGGNDETKAPETDPMLDSTETDPVETEPPVECKHTRTKEIPGSRVEPTCTEAGKYTVVCRSCEEEWDIPIPALHEDITLTYTVLDSLDGAYKKYFCSVCGDIFVADAEGTRLEDYSAVEFPFFYTSFDDLSDIKDVGNKFDGIEFADAFATQIVDFSDGEITNSYANVPTGDVSLNKNGFFALKDTNDALVANKFTISFAAKFDEYPQDDIALLTWAVGDTDYKLITVDSMGYVYVIGNTKAVASFSDKGWDMIKVAVDPASGKVDVEFETPIGEISSGAGKLGASVAGKTGSVVNFFEQVSQYEAYIDDVKFIVEK